MRRGVPLTLARLRHRRGEELRHAVLGKEPRGGLVIADRRHAAQLGRFLQGACEEVQQASHVLALAALCGASAIAVHQALVPVGEIVDALDARGARLGHSILWLGRARRYRTPCPPRVGAVLQAAPGPGRLAQRRQAHAGRLEASIDS